MITRLPTKHQRRDDDADVISLTALRILDGADDAVGELHHAFAFLDLRHTDELAEHIAGDGVTHQVVVFLLLEIDELPLAALAFRSLTQRAFGRLAQRFRDFIGGHAHGHIVFGDDLVDLQLAGVEFFQILHKLRILRGKGPGADPAGDAVARAFAADLVGLVGDGFDLNLLVGHDDAELVFAVHIGKNGGVLDDHELDLLVRHFGQVNHARIVIEQGFAFAAFRLCGEREDQKQGEAKAFHNCKIVRFGKKKRTKLRRIRNRFIRAFFPNLSCSCRKIAGQCPPAMRYPTSAKLFQTAKQLIPGGVNSPVRAFRNVGGEPFFVRRAKGSRIEDIDGKSYIDYIGTWGPAILGHAPMAVINAVHEAAKNGLSFGIPNVLEVEMAKMVTSWVPSVEKVRMTNSGTEATMSAIRLARGFTKRDKIIKFDGCYHGHSDSLLVAAGSGALTQGEPDSAGVPKAFAAETIVLPFNDRAAVEAAFAQWEGQIAALILEPYPANAGLILPQPGFLNFLRDITAKHGTVLIFDEVMTGFRLGKAGVQGLENITPDLSCFGKVIGGGLPVGAFGGRAEIMDWLAPLGPVYQAGTLSGNPLAMVAGLTQLHELDKAGAYETLDQIGANLEAGVKKIFSEKGIPHRFNRVGSMFCLFFTDAEIINLDSVKTQDLEMFRKLFWSMIDKGIYIAPSPYETGFLSLAHNREDIDETLTAMEDTIREW